MYYICFIINQNKRNNMSKPEITTISQKIFSERAAEAIEKQPLRREVHLSELEILDDQKISYKNKALKVNIRAFGDLMKILKIPVAFVKRFGEMTKEKPEAKRKLISTIKNLMSSSGTGGKTVTLVMSVESKEIIAIHKTSRNLISNKGFIETLERVIDENNLDVVDFSTSSDGEVAVNTIDTKSQFGIDGMKDEVFTGGVSFSNTPKSGFIVSPYINRLWCANGMVTKGFQEQHKLTSLDGASMQKFFSDMTKLAKSGYKPETFIERVREAHTLKASLAELYAAKNRIKNVCKDIKPYELEEWIPIQFTEQAYHRINIDTKMLRPGQLKNAATNTSVWQLINSMTHFATHDNGFEINDYDRRGLQIEAGAFLTNEHDMSNFIRNPFSIKSEDHQAKYAY